MTLALPTGGVGRQRVEQITSTNSKISASSIPIQSTQTPQIADKNQASVPSETAPSSAASVRGEYLRRPPPFALKASAEAFLEFN